MKLLYRGLLWIDLLFAVLSIAGIVRGVVQNDRAFIVKSLLAVVSWLLVALFCYRRIRAIEEKTRAMLSAFRHLGYEEALAKARETSTPLPRSLVAEKVAPSLTEWSAFERDSIQFVIARSERTSRAEVIEL